ncbi:MAG: serine hydroxymethyltransferase [Thermoproteota archaeon]
MPKVEDVLRIVENQNRWRRQECLNLIASESIISPLAEKYYVSDFNGRYNEHSGAERHYCGTKYAYEVEELCNQIFRERFETPFADVRPISGAVANMVAYSAFAKPGDVIISLGIPNGAHVSSTQWGIAGVRGLKSIDMFFDAEKMNIDVENTVRLIEKVKPRIIMFGASMFLFPEPVKEIREKIDSKIKTVYDASHVFGLIYGGAFQDPLKEGADLITSSTHKTFQGPQGGIIIGNRNLNEEDWQKIEAAIFPGITSNTHIHRFPALAITALEMNAFGKDYAKQVVRNAKKFAESLYEKGFDVLCPELGFTESHQVMVNVSRFGGGKPVSELLEASNIICNKMALPTDKPQDATRNPSGIRLGVQELTRWGMKEEEMKVVAELFKKIVMEGKMVKQEVVEFKRKFNEVHYCFRIT